MSLISSCLQDAILDSIMNGFVKHNVLVTEHVKNSWDDLIACAMTEFNDTLTATFAPYLKDIGFTSTEELAKYSIQSSEKTFSMQVLLAAMLNRIHIRILTPEGDFHTHLFNSGDICTCAVHFAVVQADKDSTDQQYITLDELSQKEREELHMWEKCTVVTYPSPISDHFPGSKFHSAQCDSKATDQDLDSPLDLSMSACQEKQVMAEPIQSEPLNLCIPS